MTTRYRIGAGLTVALAIGLAAQADADVIELRADPWCPFNCEPGSERPGYMVEIAREAFAMAGHEVNYETLNWARSLAKARRGEIDGVIGAIHEEAPDFVFGPPMGFYRDAIITRAGEQIDLSRPGAMDGLRLGAINDYEYSAPISDYLDANRDNRELVQFTSGDDALAKNLRKLIAGRIDMVAEVAVVAYHTMAEESIGGDLIVTAIDQDAPIFIAFSPARGTSVRYARDLENGIAALEASGRLEAIVTSYGLPYWN